MALKLLFNPVSGKFDYVDITDTSAFAVVTPTTMQASLTVPAHSQLVFKRKIVTQAGQRIILGADAVLVGV